MHRRLYRSKAPVRRNIGSRKVSGTGSADDRLEDFVSDIQIPLDNVAYTIEAYLMAHGSRLDTETRFLLAGIRDCADRVAGSARRMLRDTVPRREPAALQALLSPRKHI